MSEGLNIVHKKLIVIAASIGLSLSGLVYAQSNYELGTMLTPAQISTLGPLKSFTVGTTTFRILAAANKSGTYVINSQGKIGVCNGEVLISGVSTDQAKKALIAYQSSIISTTAYDSLKMVSAKFSGIQEAANARNELATTLVGATVTLPIIFNLPTANR
jgi:hypothetical protein